MSLYIVNIHLGTAVLKQDGLFLISLRLDEVFSPLFSMVSLNNLNTLNFDQIPLTMEHGLPTPMTLLIIFIFILDGRLFELNLFLLALMMLSC